MASTTLDDDAVPTPTKSPTTFLTLPAELRNTIYTLSGNLESIQTWDTANFQCRCVSPRDSGGATLICRKHLMACRFCHCHDPISDDPASFSLWVNRNSAYAVNGSKGHKMHGLRCNSVDHHHQPLTRSKAPSHAAHIKNGVEQPALTKVSKKVRDETLPIFYGSHSFLFTLFDREIDSASIFKWVRTIGKDNAGLLRKVSIVVRNNKDLKYAENELIPALKRQGLKTEGREVEVYKLPYPNCYCEGCVRKLLGEM